MKPTSQPRNSYLLTGRPGAGKTSLIKEVIAPHAARAGRFGARSDPDLSGSFPVDARGFDTRKGCRYGGHHVRSGVLASAGRPGPFRVGNYSVDVESLNAIGVTAILSALAGREIIVIDEIGKMELFSEEFKRAVLAALDGGKKVLRTILLAPHPWADGIKARPDVKVIRLTQDNRDEVREKIASWLAAA